MGTSDRDAGAEVDRIDEHTPIDGMRDGAAEPRVVPRPGAGRAAWCEVEPQRVGVDGHSQIEDAKAAGACELADGGEVLGANFRVEQIHLSRLESQQLGVLGRDHTQRERGPAWRLGVQAGGEPAWIAGELQTLTGAVRPEDEWSQPDELVRRCLDGPLVAQRARLERSFQTMGRKDREALQSAEAGAVGLGVGQHDRMSVDGPHVDPFSADEESTGQGACRPGIVEGVEGEDHIGRGEWLAIREGDIASQAERVTPAIRRHRPRLGECGLNLLRGVVQADQSRVEQLRHDQRGSIDREQPVERPRFGSQRGDDAGGSRRGIRGGPVVRSRRPPHHGGGEGEHQEREQQRATGRAHLEQSGQEAGQPASALAMTRPIVINTL